MRRAAAYALDRRALAAVFGELPSDRLIPPAIAGPGGNIALHERTRPGRGAQARRARGEPQSDPLLLRRSRQQARRGDRPRESRRDRDRRSLQRVAQVPDRPRSEEHRGGGHPARVTRGHRSRPRAVRRVRVRRRLFRARLLAQREPARPARQRPRERAAPRAPAPTPRSSRRSCATRCPWRSTPAGSTRSSSRRGSAARCRRARSTSPTSARSACAADQPPAAIVHV